MSIAQETPILPDTSPEITEDVIFPPGDLYSDEPPLETYLHLMQIIILLTSLDWWWRDRTDYFAAGNLTIYYSPRQLKSEHFRGPDLFVVLDTQKKPRRSWTVWRENDKYPDLIIEILSNKTAKTDRGLKKEIYQNVFRTSDYFWFDPDSLEFQGFHLVDKQYQAIEPNEQGLFKSKELGLYLGLYQDKLRWFTDQGELIPTPEEDAEIQRQKTLEAERDKLEAERAKLEAEQAQSQAEQAKLEAEQKLTAMESILVRYQQQFGDLGE